MNSLTPEAVYTQLGQLIAQMPNFEEYPLSDATHRWLGQAFALLEQSGVTIDAGIFKNAALAISGPNTRDRTSGAES